MKAAAVVSVWRWVGAGSASLLGNQFAQADAQQGTNFCGLQQLFSDAQRATWSQLLALSVGVSAAGRAPLNPTVLTKHCRGAEDRREMPPARIRVMYLVLRPMHNS